MLSEAETCGVEMENMFTLAHGLARASILIGCCPGLIIGGDPSYETKLREFMQPTTKSPGLTPTERYLSAVSEQTFLSLWSYPNLYRAPGKELCDLLVVFDQQIIIFSDKDISFPTNVDIITGWDRWKKKSIDKSISQLYGAERWLIQNPTKLYFDAACEHEFPFLDPEVKYEIHLVAVTKNSHEPAKKHFGLGSSGSFMIVPLASDEYIKTRPFLLNDNSRKKTFVHVLDEVTLNLLFAELDTAYDLISYLSAKEHAIRNHDIQIIPGEEDLLGFYLLSGGLINSDQLRIKDPELANEFEAFSLGEGFWREYLTSSERAALKEANEISYFWDELIETFGKNILQGSVPEHVQDDITVHERSIRWMAREGRLARRFLSRAFLEKMEESFRDRRTSRVCFSPVNKHACFVLVLYPRDDGEDYVSYRAERVEILHRYALATKVQFPRATQITVIGTEPKGSLGRSEDVLAIEIDMLDEETRALGERIIEEDGILKHAHVLNEKTPIYPASDTSPKRSRTRMFAKVGRNEPCPCGSGKKYKKCCLGQGFGFD